MDSTAVFQRASTSYLPIEQYAVIGNCQSAALVSTDGSIDWWCPLRFEQPSVFGALLDARCGGRFVLRPAGSFSVHRRYVDRTNVLETTFTTPSGLLRVTDAMAIGAPSVESRSLTLTHAIIRAVECLQGEVEIELQYQPRFNYGHVVPTIRDRGPSGFVCEYRGDALELRADLPLELSENGAAVHARVRLQQGMCRTVGLTFARGEPLVVPPLGTEARAALATTIDWWRAWAARCRYAGPYVDHVVRSALVLKLMTFAPSGAMVAAPTTSLPEDVGGVRNWDYRYCWLRDASMTIRALLGLGFQQESEAFLSWLLHTTRLTWPRLRVVYDVFGRPNFSEQTLPMLSGYLNSRPVRIGNAAVEQLQLDVYGEVTGAARAFVQAGRRLPQVQARSLVDLGTIVCRLWLEPDEGIWEIRSRRRHHTYSKAMCWVALNDLLLLHQAGHVRVPVQAFRREREAIRRAIDAYGYNPRVGSYVSAFGGDEVDASLLLLALRGYTDPHDPRMRSTYHSIRHTLSMNGLVRRYPVHTDDGVPGDEGVFGICGFWLVRFEAMLGEAAAARARFEHLLSLGNDLGLFAEEVDPATGAALGNFPQAFTHIGLINAALALERIGSDADRLVAVGRDS